MKAFQLAMFTFIFMGVIAFLQTPEVGLVDSEVIHIPAWTEDYEDKFNLTYQETPNGASWYEEVLVDLENGIIKGKYVVSTMLMFIDILIYSVVRIDEILKIFNLPDGLRMIIAGVAWLIYGAAVVQLISGRIVKTNG